MLGRRLLFFVGVLVVLLGPVVAAAPAQAHPLGNFTVNTHLGLRVEPFAVAVDVLVDVAEVPTLQAFPSLEDGGAVPEAEQARYLERMCTALRDAVEVTVGGRGMHLSVIGRALSFPEGDAGLRTTRLGCELRSGHVATVGYDVKLTDFLQVQPVGWREVIAVGDGVELVSSDVPAGSVSAVLRDYPEHLLQRPLDQRGAHVTVAAGSGVVTGDSAVGDDATASATETSGGFLGLAAELSDVVDSRDLTVTWALLGVLAAAGLGAAHALAPGHGKSLMAALLLGRATRLRDVSLIGLSVTATHTAGVLVLGAVVTVTSAVAPTTVYAWLGLVSGLLLVGIGVALLRTAMTTVRHAPAPVHVHTSGHPHTHRHVHGHTHGHSHGHTSGTRVHADGIGAVGRPRSLLAVGFAGGLVPSPSALVVLLGAVALGRAWFGVLLVLAYGLGMALALVGAGLLLVRTRDRLASWSARTTSPSSALLTTVLRALPAGSAAAVVVVGAGLSGMALTRL